MEPAVLNPKPQTLKVNSKLSLPCLCFAASTHRVGLASTMVWSTPNCSKMDLQGEGG